MALTFGAYAFPELRRPLGVSAVVALTAVEYQGVRKTAWLARATVIVVLTSLVAVVRAALLGGEASTDRLGSFGTGALGGILEAAGLLFFAFAGYARIVTWARRSSTRPYDPPRHPAGPGHHPRRVRGGRSLGAARREP